MQQFSFDGGGFNTPQEEIRYLRQENTRLQSAFDKALAELRQLKSYLKWEDKLFATPSEIISDAHKVIARALPKVVKKAKSRVNTDTARDDGLARVYMSDIAASTGKNEKRIGANLKEMHDRGLVERDFKPGFNREKGKPDNAVFLDMTPELIELNLKAAAANPRNTGNNQKNFICKACHSTNTVARKVIEVTCRDCGTITLLDPSKKEDRAFIVDDETAENFAEWYGEADLEDMLADTMPREVVTPDNIIPFPTPQSGCTHDEEFKFTHVNGAPGCRICDAPWEVPHGN